MHLSYSNTRLSTHSARGGVSVIREIDVETGVWKEDTDAVALVIVWPTMLFSLPVSTGVLLIGPDVPLCGVVAGNDGCTVLTVALDAEVQAGTPVSEGPTRALVI